MESKEKKAFVVVDLEFHVGMTGESDAVGRSICTSRIMTSPVASNMLTGLNILKEAN